MRDRATGELMHPAGGPIAEAERLYLAPSRLEDRLRSGAAAAPLTLLDIGLGAGSNAAAAFRLSERLGSDARRLQIVSFERSFEAFELALDAEHCADFGLSGVVRAAASELLNVGAVETRRTTWRLSRGELPATLAREAASSAEVVFWDPFSPRAEPVLWSIAAFTALRRLCNDSATIHTYSGATGVRTALLLAGFAVGVGPEISPGKFSTIAAVHACALERPLDRRFIERVARSSAPFPRDAPRDALSVLRELPLWDA